MNNIKIKSLVILLGIILTTISLATISEAATLSISTSKSSVSPGETFQVTITLTNGAGYVTSDGQTQWLDNSSFSYTKTAGSSGSVTITATGVVADYTTEQDETVSDSKSVTIVQPVVETPPTTNNSNGSSSSTNSNGSSSSNTPTTKKSDNSKLKSLQIAEGAITPEFSSSVKEYSINVPNEITKLSIAAVADSSKATIKIIGNEELQVGENTIEIVVTAEDGSKTTYSVLTKRAEKELALQSLNLFYTNENGEKVELLLNPQFVFNIYEYQIDEILSYKIENIEVVGIANRENAIIEVLGNEQLKTGQNEIIVKVTMTDEAGLEEQKTYKIVFEKQVEPVVVPETPINKISNLFNGIGTAIGNWISGNFNKIITGMLLIATTAFVGLTIYFVYDYKNYQKVLSKLAELNKASLMERANVALDPEKAINKETEKIQEISEKEVQPEKKIKGRRFK